MHKAGLIRGDGIGPEICAAALEIIAATGVQIEWEEILVGQQAVARWGRPLPVESLQKLQQHQHVLKAPLVAEKCGAGIVVETESGTRRYPSINNALRRELGCYANIRPIRSWGRTSGQYSRLDLVLIREVTEDIYIGEERQMGSDAAEAIKRITRHASERIGRLAFAYARQHGRSKVTAVHKANVLHLTDGLFLRSVAQVAIEFPGLAFDDVMVDAACYHLIKSPERFDVLVLTNQYGDILSDMTAGLAGSLGLAPGMNIGESVALYEAAHGAAPDIASKGVANPIGLLLSGALLLEGVEERDAAESLRQAVAAILSEGRWLTPDLGGTATTRELTSTLIDSVAKRSLPPAARSLSPLPQFSVAALGRSEDGDRVALIHTSPAAVEPVASFYRKHAPELRFFNLLEDALLESMAAQTDDLTERRLAEMIRTASTEYGAAAAVLTCSALSFAMTSRLRAGATVPVLKIDEPMACAAVRLGSRVGVLATFECALSTTRALLEATAQAEGKKIFITEAMVSGAYSALLEGKPQVHDALLEQAAQELAGQHLDVLVLAQVSMARALPRIQAGAPFTVLSSLETSLAELKQLLKSPRRHEILLYSGNS